MEDDKDEALEIKKLCREYSLSVTKSMIEIALNKKYSPSVRVQAGQLILDRGYGKPGQSLEVKNTQSSFIGILRGMRSPKTVDVDVEESGAPKEIESADEKAKE